MLNAMVIPTAASPEVVALVLVAEIEALLVACTSTLPPTLVTLVPTVLSSMLARAEPSTELVAMTPLTASEVPVP